MNTINTITEKELLTKVEAGVSGKAVWQQPLLLLTSNGSDYTYMIDSLDEKYPTHSINTDAPYYDFVHEGGSLELSLQGTIVDGHRPDVAVYENLGGPFGYDERTHRYCVGLVEYEAKPVISFICVTDKNCAIENIPAWMKEQFEIAMLKLDY